MNELPKNPNTRPPYSDVSQELNYYVSKAVEYIDGRPMTSSERKEVKGMLRRLDQALLRARAVLDPITLNEAEWKKASEHTAFDLPEEE